MTTTWSKLPNDKFATTLTNDLLTSLLSAIEYVVNEEELYVLEDISITIFKRDDGRYQAQIIQD